MRRLFAGRRRIVLVAGVGLAALLILVPPVVVWGSSARHDYGSADAVPAAPVAIVLGAGVDASGRLPAAADLGRGPALPAGHRPGPADER